jgi:hypothetical protein
MPVTTAARQAGPSRDVTKRTEDGAPTELRVHRIMSGLILWARDNPDAVLTGADILNFLAEQ